MLSDRKKNCQNCPKTCESEVPLIPAKKTKCCQQGKCQCLILLFRLNQINLVTTFSLTTSICSISTTCGASDTSPIAFYGNARAINPWGLMFYNNNIWSANEGSQSITSYDNSGSTATNIYIVTSLGIPQNPTGIVSNTNTQAFVISTGGNGEAGVGANLISQDVITVTLQGGIFGFNSASGATTANLLYQNPCSNASYTGCAISGNNLIVANFGTGTVDIFSIFTSTSTFLLSPPVTSTSNLNGLNCLCATSTNFSDPYPVIGYAPFNIAVVNGNIFISYAKNSGSNYPGSIYAIREGYYTGKPLVPSNLNIGEGLGYINIFNNNGGFIRRFANSGSLNAPWGILPAPYLVAFPPGSILIGNFGDGTINIYNFEGVYFGKIRNLYGSVNRIPGLWGLAINPIFPSVFYFSAGIENETKGLIGYFNTN